MRLVDRLRGVVVPYPVNDPAWTGSPMAGLMQTYLDNDSTSTEKVNSGEFSSYATVGYAGNGTIFSVLNARLRLFTEATFKYRTLDTKRIYGNVGLQLLEQPWPGARTSTLLARMIQDADLAGNAFIRKVSDTQLQRLRPDWVDIVHGLVDDGGDWGRQIRVLLGYAYYEGGKSTGRPVFLLPDEVAHWAPIPDPLATFRGMSWLTPVVREVNADIVMLAHQQKFFDNAATPNMVVKYQRKMPEDSIRRLVEQIRAGHTGVGEAWKTLILDEGADATVVGAKFAEMAFTSLQQANEARIASAGGVPPIVAGLQAGLDASTFANYGAAYRNFSDSTMHPLWRGACESLEPFTVPATGSQLWFDTRDIPALRDAEMDRQKGHAQMSIAVMNLVNSGYEPDSVVASVVSGDMTLLKHTGLVSVQLLRPGKEAPQPAGLGPDGQPDGGTP